MAGKFWNQTLDSDGWKFEVEEIRSLIYEDISAHDKVSSMEYDCVLALGSGIDKDGLLPENSLSVVNKAVDLYTAKKAAHIIFSGRWSYQAPFTPPFTEAQAMKQTAIELGVPADDILTEDESVTTVSNLCLVKQNILAWKGWKRIVLVGIDPHAPRTLYNAQRVLGDEYTCNLQLADFQYPEPLMSELRALEEGKLQDAKNFYQEMPIGDDERIYNAAMADLQQNYIDKK